MMQKRLILLSILWLTFPSILFADGDLSFPADPCISSWSHLPSEAYLYQYGKDFGYSAFLERLRANQIDRKQCHKTWTVLIYMSATKDMLPYGVADLLEMESPMAGSSLRSDVVVQLNNGISQKSQRLHIFPNQNAEKRLVSKQDLKTLTEYQILSPRVFEFEPDPESPEQVRFEEFLRWGIEEYPSEHYFVIIWGHGQVWTGLTSATSGITSQTHLSLPNIRQVLKSLKKWRGDPIDVFAADSCFMQSTEDVTELSKYSHYICGSEDIESYAGFPYEALLSELNSGKFGGASRLASNMERSYSEPYLAAWMVPYLYQSSFDLKHGSQRELDPRAYYDLTGSSVMSKNVRLTLVPALNNLGEALSQYIQENPEHQFDLRSLVRRGEHFRGNTQDLGDFLKRLDGTLRIELAALKEKKSVVLGLLESALRKANSALTYTVINFALGEKYGQFDPKKEYGPRGLSIWLPKTAAEYRSKIEDFKRSKLFKPQRGRNLSGWAKWLDDLHTDPPEIAPQP
jgi:hypothetical protein